MKSPSSRPFTLLDGMILVAATAAGFATIRAHSRFLLLDLPHPQGSWRLLDIMGWVLRWITPFLEAWSFAFLVIAYREPHPRWRVWLRRPGNVACIAATMALACEYTWIALICVRFWEPHRRLWGQGYVPSLHPMSFVSGVGSWIVGAWLALFLSGSWRPARGWVERLGRAIGIVWILAWIVPSVLRAFL